MTPKARAAFELYRDLGPDRSLTKVAEMQGRRSSRQLETWSSRYNWQRLMAEHDHAEMREALGQREIVRERGTQLLVDWIPRAAAKLLQIMTDERALPVLDRNGEQIEGPDGEPLFRPVVKASVQRAQVNETKG